MSINRDDETEGPNPPDGPTLKRPYEQHRWRDWDDAEQWAEAIREKGTWAEVEDIGDEYVVKVTLNATVAAGWLLHVDDD